QSVRAVLADVEPACVARSMAARTPRPRATGRDSGERQMGDPRQAGPGEHQRAGAVSRIGWIEPLADEVLLAETYRRAPAATAWSMNFSISAAGRTPVVLAISRPSANTAIVGIERI